MKSRIALAVTLGALLAPGSAAAAPDTVIDFNTLPNGALIADQYAGQGVRFGAASSFGFPAPTYRCSGPYAAAAALNGTAANMACNTGGEIFTQFFNTAIEFDVERRKVSFNLVQRTTDAARQAVVRFYGIGAKLLNQTTVTLSRNVVRPVSYDHGITDGGIVGVVIDGDGASGSTGGVFLDDLRATLDDTPPARKFSLALATPTVDVVEGSTGAAKLSVRRYNGSTGPVTLAVDSLPPGIKATSFTPNPVNGVDPAALNITAARPFTGQAQITVTATGSASAGTGIGTTLVQTVTGIPALYFSSGGRSAIRLVPGCGPQRIDDNFTVRGGYSGYTDYNFAGSIPASGLQRLTTTTGPSLSVSGDGIYPIHYNLDPGDNRGSGSFTVELNPYGASKASITQNWIADPLKIDRVPAWVERPPVDGGSAARVIGNFPRVCPVRFLDALGQEWTVRDRGLTEVDGKLLDDLILILPETAVSGPLRIVNAAGTEVAKTQPIDVREYRRTYGFRIANSGDGARSTYSWADFERTFGTDDTDSCFIVCVHDPIAADYYSRYKQWVERGAGLCFGYATMSARFRGYGTGQRPSDYQAGATRAWDIAPVVDGTPIKRDIVRWFVAQDDRSQREEAERAKQRSAADERKLLKDLIAAQGAALISIRQDGSGHAVTAYGVRDTAGGGMIINIYDSNVPFDSVEQTDKDQRVKRLGRSLLIVAADGSWSGSSLGWSGDNSTLTVRANIPPQNAQLPSNFSIASLLGSSGGEAPPAEIAGIVADGKPQLDGKGRPRPGSSVRLVPALNGNGSVPEYELAKGHAYELKIKGSGKGAYDSSLLTGAANASVRGAATAAGQVDRVTIRPGQASLRFSTGASKAPVAYDLKSRVGKTTRSATIAITARSGGNDSAQLAGGAVRLVHNGPPTRATVTLTSVGGALPSSAQLQPLEVGRGERLEVSPRSWSNVAGRVHYTVRDKRGRVLRRGRARLKAPGRIALRAVAAKRNGKKLTVTGRVAKRGSAPVLAAVASVTKGGRQIRRRTASRRDASVRKGRFKLALTIGSVPRGAKVAVEVLLSDPAGGTVRKRVRVRP
jgi:hypothetical protein